MFQFGTVLECRNIPWPVADMRGASALHPSPADGWEQRARAAGRRCLPSSLHPAAQREEVAQSSTEFHGPVAKGELPLNRRSLEHFSPREMAFIHPRSEAQRNLQPGL